MERVIEDQRGGALMDCHLLSSDTITHMRGGGGGRRGGGGGRLSDRDISTGQDVTTDFSMTNDLVRPRRRSLGSTAGQHI